MMGSTNQVLALAITTALLAACSGSHSMTPIDAGGEDAGRDASELLPGEIRTLRVGWAHSINALVVDTDDNLCGTVAVLRGPRMFDLLYGCFEGSEFVPQATIVHTLANPYDLQIDSQGHPSFALGVGSHEIAGRTYTDGSCWVRLVGAEVLAQCLEAPLGLYSVSYEETSGRVAAIIHTDEDTMVAGVPIARGTYILDGLPLRDASQLHSIGFNITPEFIAWDAGGLVVGGQFSHTREHGLPFLQEDNPFSARLDAAFAMTSIRAYPLPHRYNVLTSWQLNGHDIVGVSTAHGETAEEEGHFLLRESDATSIRVGTGGDVVAMATRGDVVAGRFAFMGYPSITLGSTTLSAAGNNHLLATFTREGEVLTVRRITPWSPRDVVMFSDQSIAFAQGNVVHVLSSR